MSDQVPTVKIKSGDSFANINESDFDAKLHERYEDEESVSPFAKMKVEELKAYAAEHNIDLADATKKADILAKIEAAQ